MYVPCIYGVFMGRCWHVRINSICLSFFWCRCCPPPSLSLKESTVSFVIVINGIVFVYLWRTNQKTHCSQFCFNVKCTINHKIITRAHNFSRNLLLAFCSDSFDSLPLGFSFKHSTHNNKDIYVFIIKSVSVMKQVLSMYECLLWVFERYRKRLVSSFVKQ